MNTIDQLELLQFNEAFELATKNKDREALDRMIADDYSFVGPTGHVLGKSHVLNDILTGRIKFGDSKRTHQTVRIHGDTAVLTSVITMRVSYMLRDVGGQYIDTQAFVRGEKGWQMISAQLRKIQKKTH